MGLRCALALLCVLCLFVLTGDTRQDHLTVTVTAYSRGTVTASGVRVRVGHIALSRDVEHALGAHFGDRIQVQDIGTFIFYDRMPWYWHRRVDVYMPSRVKALQFGKQHHTISRLQVLSGAPSPSD